MSVSGVTAVGSRSSYATTAKVWGLLVAYLMVAKLLITYVFPVAFLQGSGQADVFAWPALLIFSLLGLVGLWFAHRAGFAAALDERVTNLWRFVYPLLIGSGFGLITIATDQVFDITGVVTANTGNATFNIAFPGSLFAYSAGAIIVEVLYRFFTLSLVVWLISNVLLRGRYQTPIFWVVALVLAAWEPISQAQFAQVASPLIPAATITSGYAFNLVQNVLFRRFGFLAPFTMRIGDYAVWHIIYGNFICQC
ncbi:MAG: hypothetical protein ACYC4L_20110 [Chloroflexota bacterium]